VNPVAQLAVSAIVDVGDRLVPVEGPDEEGVEAGAVLQWDPLAAVELAEKKSDISIVNNLTQVFFFNFCLSTKFFEVEEFNSLIGKNYFYRKKFRLLFLKNFLYAFKIDSS
jgi:hypothetical protein